LYDHRLRVRVRELFLEEAVNGKIDFVIYMHDPAWEGQLVWLLGLWLGKREKPVTFEIHDDCQPAIYKGKP